MLKEEEILEECSMPQLSPRDRELVSLGAAMASNCVPCIEHHIPQARNAGLSDPEISEAIQISDRVRQVPARKVLDVALQLVNAGPAHSGVG
jgi:4-carboxymuconolactone decarboxylase